MENIKFQVVTNLKLTGERCSENELIKGLMGEKMKKRIEPIRQLVSIGKIEEANTLKAKLPAFIVSGIFEGGRTSKHLIGHTGVLCLDLDKLDVSEIEALKDKAINEPYTFMTFISPSGRGIKILVKANASTQDHISVYKQVVAHYTKVLGKNFDANTHDITRLTYMSYDPSPYYYPDSELFPALISERVPVLLHSSQANSSEYRDIYEHAFSVAERSKGKYDEGNRNNVISLTAWVCNHYGLPKQELLKCLEWCELPQREKEQTINSAYKKVEVFGTKKLDESSGIPLNYNAIPLQKAEESDECNPFIPASIKARFPDFVNDFIEQYPDLRQNDMAFTAFICLLSSLMSNIVSAGRGDEHYPALGSVITAPSGSGKSVTAQVQRLFFPEHQRMLNQGTLRHGLLLPDNITTTGLIKALGENNGVGMLFSSDLGFFGRSIKRDLHRLQAFFRTSQSGESLRKGQIAAPGLDIISHPKLAVCLAALPQEFKSLFDSRDDGVISRFLHYGFTPSGNWIPLIQETVAAQRCRQEQAQIKIAELNNYLSGKQFEFEFHAEQVLALNEWFESRFFESNSSPLRLMTNPIVLRMQHHLIRLCMTLATLKAFETNYQGRELIIGADDFDAMLKLTDVYMIHAFTLVGSNFPKQTNSIDPQLERLLNALPDIFKRKDAIEAAKLAGLSVSTRTIDNLLRRLMELGYVGKDNGFNSYRKKPKDSYEMRNAA